MIVLEYGVEASRARYESTSSSKQIDSFKKPQLAKDNQFNGFLQVQVDFNSTNSDKSSH